MVTMVDVTYVYDSTGATLHDSATFVGDIATFNSGSEYKLTDATDYLIVLDSGGASYTQVNDTSTTGTHTYTYPIVGTELDLISGINSGTTTSSTEMYNITNIVTNSVNASGQATSIDISFSGGGVGDATDDTTTNILREVDTDSSTSTKDGIDITLNENVIFKNITKHSNCTAKKCYIYDYTGTILFDSSLFVGDVATFENNKYFESGTSIIIVVEGNGTSYIRKDDSRTAGTYTWSFPIVGTYLDVDSGILNMVSNTSNVYNITDIVTQTATLSVTTPVTLTNNNTGVVDVTSLGVGTLKITKTFKTTDVSVSPSTKGLGVTIIK